MNDYWRSRVRGMKLLKGREEGWGIETNRRKDCCFAEVL
jgi:hypothetical protein